MAEQSTPKGVVGEGGKFMSAVKVGPKGQVVIPKEVRDMFAIAPGDTLLILADSARGMALHRMDYFDRIADEIFTGALGAPEGSGEREAGLRFVNAVHTAKEQAAQPQKEE